ncbi:TetR/AcrR family transcriptional regulator [Streptomyces sp. NPDC127097]|uniref:TetR/AcrR family transcriptional regulator n=1 Tax=Streptomyces sp. NPDC127097 TaxID=3347136 RepID=UPI003648D11B
MTTDSTPRPPQQKRSRAAMERILGAAQELVAERGAAALTIAGVAVRAKVAVGTIYSRFAGKDALLAAVQDRWLDQLIARQQANRTAVTETSADFPDTVARCVSGMISTFHDHADLIREFALRNAGQPVQDTALHKLQEVFTQLCDVILAHPGRPDEIDRRRVALAMRAVQATLEWRVTTPLAVAPDNDWDTLSQDLPGLAMRYLSDNAS